MAFRNLAQAARQNCCVSNDIQKSLLEDLEKKSRSLVCRVVDAV